MVVHPLELPLVPVSCTADQPPRAWILLTTEAPAGTSSAPLAETPLTVTVTSVTQEAPLSPHDLTWRVCEPEEDETWVSMEVPLMIVVSLLLSKE